MPSKRRSAFGKRTRKKVPFIITRPIRRAGKHPDIRNGVFYLMARHRMFVGNGMRNFKQDVFDNIQGDTDSRS